MKTTALLIIDVQNGFDDPLWGRRNNLNLESNVEELLRVWRRSGNPVFHVQHDSLEPNSPLVPGQPGNSIKAAVGPLAEEPVYRKRTNSAFIGTTLEADLRRQGIETLIICGLTSNHCVSTTARMSANLGFKTYVIHDATAAFDRKGFDGVIRSAEEVHRAALRDLHEEFATIIETEQACEMATGLYPKALETAPALGDSLLDPAQQAYMGRMIDCLEGQEPLAVLTQSVPEIERFLQSAEEAQLTFKPRAEKWSVQEILAHLADSEMVLSFRIRQILAEDGVTIQPYDQDEWAALANYYAIPASESFVRFASTRKASLAILRNLTPAQLRHEGVHGERGRSSVAEWIRLWAGHDVNHINQIRELLSNSQNQ